MTEPETSTAVPTISSPQPLQERKHERKPLTKSQAGFLWFPHAIVWVWAGFGMSLAGASNEVVAATAVTGIIAVIGHVFWIDSKS